MATVRPLPTSTGPEQQSNSTLFSPTKALQTMIKVSKQIDDKNRKKAERLSNTKKNRTIEKAFFWNSPNDAEIVPSHSGSFKGHHIAPDNETTTCTSTTVSLTTASTSPLLVWPYFPASTATTAGSSYTSASKSSQEEGFLSKILLSFGSTSQADEKQLPKKQSKIERDENNQVTPKQELHSVGAAQNESSSLTLKPHDPKDETIEFFACDPPSSTEDKETMIRDSFSRNVQDGKRRSKKPNAGKLDTWEDEDEFELDTILMDMDASVASCNTNSIFGDNDANSYYENLNNKKRKASPKSSSSGIPNRLVDYFCVIGPEMRIDPFQEHPRAKSPCDLRLKPIILDCYPSPFVSRDDGYGCLFSSRTKTRAKEAESKQEESRSGDPAVASAAYADEAFPQHLPTFCFPDSCHVTTEPQAPRFFTLALQNSAGHRLYGSVLTIWEDTMQLKDFCEFYWNQGRPIPSWLGGDGNNDNNYGGMSTNKKKKSNYSKLFEHATSYYLPKCLVVISHHAFFNVQRQFLTQLLRIYHSGTSPLPLERYIANFCEDIPLPPLGRKRVQWNCFSKSSSITLARPAPNEMPLVNFSFRPLLRCLSVSNILVLWGILLQEGRVVLCSQHTALLTPVAEALLTLLFPLNWQSMYIPVLPNHMIDVLDAPLPFLVGMHGQCLKHQPAGVVVCDLDQDIVHLGLDDSYNPPVPRDVPALPDKNVIRLKVELEEAADPLYLVPPCGVKGRMTSGEERVELRNAMREPYAHMSRIKTPSSAINNHRQYIMSSAEHVKGYFETLGTEEYDVIRDEVIYDRSDISVALSAASDHSAPMGILDAFQQQQREFQAHKDVFMAKIGQKYASPSPHVVKPTDAVDGENLEEERYEIVRNLYDIDEDLAKTVRRTFLRFFTTLMICYKDFLVPSFQYENFLDSLSLTEANRQCVKNIIMAQMFERFLNESSTRRKLFDEHVIRERNQSMWSQNLPTPFLDDKRWVVKKVITPAAPYSIGIWKGKTYSYPTFPKLDPNEFKAHETHSNPLTSFCEGAFCSIWLCFG